MIGQRLNKSVFQIFSLAVLFPILIINCAHYAELKTLTAGTVPNVGVQTKWMPAATREAPFFCLVSRSSAFLPGLGVPTLPCHESLA